MNKVIVGDADVLIALIFEEDSLHRIAKDVSKKLYKTGGRVIFPNTAIAEAVTTLLRKHSNPKLASYLTEQYKDDRFAVEYVDEKIMKLAAELFNPKSSKQNTFFDAIVAACAKTLSADAIFSFDGWYRKIGFRLAVDLP